MALVFDAPVSNEALTTFVRNVPVDSELRLLNQVPSRTVARGEISLAEVFRRNRTARYRSFDGRIHVSARDGGTTKTVKLLPLSSSLSMGEYERLQLEFARTGGTNTAALADAIYDDATQLTREVHARLEQALGDVLTDGVLTLNENGLVGVELDFGVPVNQKVIAATVWSNVAAPALTNLIAWRDVYIANNGSAPGAIRTSRTVISHLQRNTEIINAIYGSAAGRTRASFADLQTLLASEGLPPLVESYDTQVDVDGTLVRVIPENRLLFTPENLGDLVNTVYGVSATALELVNSNKADFSFEEAPGIVGVITKDGPPFRQYSFVDGVAMPVLNDARRLLTAQVLV
ncbi:major capsid protein [Cellulomonas iranensis]|uniref:major capsid protein n=1 Tax=Cellulomonas iranensis TaxID=76862 RepID=UPI000B3BF9A0|nr:major capsid protein [Cellulomonas iranensis]